MSSQWNRGEILSLMNLMLAVVGLIIAIVAFATPEVRRCLGLESGGCIFVTRKTNPDSKFREKTNITPSPQTPQQSPSTAQGQEEDQKRLISTQEELSNSMSNTQKLVDIQRKIMENQVKKEQERLFKQQSPQPTPSKYDIYLLDRAQK